MADAPPPSLLGGHDGLLSFDNSTGGEYPGPTTWNVFSPANNSTDSTHSNGITGIGKDFACRYIFFFFLFIYIVLILIEKSTVMSAKA